MKNNKGLLIAVIILSVLVVAMGSYIVYDNRAEVKEYTYEDVKGLYTYRSETVKDDLGNEYDAFYYLYLYENGTFTYTMGTGASHGYIGNYIMKENTIVLNYLFKTDNGTGVHAATGSKTITITAKDTIVDANPSVTVANMTKATLKKASSAEASEFLQHYNVPYILKNYDLTNDATNY